MFVFLQLILLAVISGADTPKESAVKVLVVGVFHFDSPGLDLFNMKVKDILGERRQKEILELVKRLEGFAPTKVAVEAPFGSTTMQGRLDKFLKGEYQLKESEVDQVALRIAKDLGHTKIYSVDFKQDMDFDGVFKFAKDNGQDEMAQQIMKNMAEKIQPMCEEAYLESNSIVKIVSDMNRAGDDRTAHGMYMSMLRIGKDDKYVGADLVAGWQTRNLKIVNNLVRIADRPDDRILLIIGSGHGPWIRQYVQQMPGFELVDAETFLKP